MEELDLKKKVFQNTSECFLRVRRSEEFTGPCPGLMGGGGVVNWLGGGGRVSLAQCRPRGPTC